MQRPRRGDDRGVSALELAFIAPSLLLLIFFVIQGALFLYARSVALQTARDMVSQLRTAQSQADFDALSQGVSENATSFADHVGSGALTDLRTTPSYTPDRVTVRVTGASITLVPGMTFHVTETASGTVEHFQTDD